MSEKLSPEAEKILSARRAAISEFKAIDSVERPLDDPAVIRLSNARLYEAAVMIRVVNGDNIAASEIKAATDMIDAARSAIPKPIRVDVKIVDGVTGCPKCGYSGSDLRLASQASQPARTIDAKPITADAKPADDVKPKSKPEPPKLPYHPHQDISTGNPVKQINGGFHPYLGAHKTPNAITSFAFETDHKPRNGGA
jgi:hypothetical protein